MKNGCDPYETTVPRDPMTGNDRPEGRVFLSAFAVHFGGGADALDLLARVHEQRGETEQATEAEDRARALRERPASIPGGIDPPEQPG